MTLALHDTDRDLANPIKSVAYGWGMKAKEFVLAAIEKALAADNDGKRPKGAPK